MSNLRRMYYAEQLTGRPLDLGGNSVVSHLLQVAGSLVPNSSTPFTINLYLCLVHRYQWGKRVTRV